MRIDIEQIKKGDLIRFEYESSKNGQITAGEYVASKDQDTATSWTATAKYYLLARPETRHDVVVVGRKQFEEMIMAWARVSSWDESLAKQHGPNLDHAIYEVYQTYLTWKHEGEEK